MAYYRIFSYRFSNEVVECEKESIDETLMTNIKSEDSSTKVNESNTVDTSTRYWTKHINLGTLSLLLSANLWKIMMVPWAQMMSGKISILMLIMKLWAYMIKKFSDHQGCLQLSKPLLNRFTSQFPVQLIVPPQFPVQLLLPYLHLVQERRGNQWLLVYRTKLDTDSILWKILGSWQDGLSLKLRN